MGIKRHFEESELEEKLPEVFDLSADVEVTMLNDSDLLFRESIVKAFYEIAVRTGKPVYGFSKSDLEEKYNEIVEEFQSRGRDYLVPLDRGNSTKNTQTAISRHKKANISKSSYIIEDIDEFRKGLGKFIEKNYIKISSGGNSDE
jgi:hypothetical protein